MFRETNTETIIENRMFDNVPSDIDRSEGSFIYDAIIPAGKEIATAYINMDKILNMAFASTAAANGYYTQLELRCSEVGISRKAGTLANGTITFAGADGTIIPAGTLIQSFSGLKFSTLAIATIASGTATVKIQALIEGTSYNLPSNSIIQAPIAINGVTSITNTVSTTGGTAKETDSALLERYYLQVKSPATSGNKNHYLNWALSVDGCGGAKVVSLWNGNGTVKVIIINSNKEGADVALVDSVSRYIESVRPIGATVTTVSATPLQVNINITLTIEANNYTLNTVKANIETSITEYLKSIAFKQGNLSYAKLGSIILSSEGVKDYSSLLVNSGSTNITIKDDEIAILGTVEIGVI